MALGTIFLKDAIYQGLIANQTLVEVTNHMRPNVMTGQVSLGIGEVTSEVLEQTPFIGFEIIDTEPLVRQVPTLGHYKSKVFIFVISNHQEKTTYIADVVQCQFASPPERFDQKWFCDLSTECITTKHVAFVSRLRFGRRGQNVFNIDTDTYLEAVELDIVWRDAPCNGEDCCEYNYEDCEIIKPNIDDNDNDCCED